MRIAPLLGLYLVGSLFIFLPNAQAGEKDELALVINQLGQIQDSLDRARVASAQDEQSGRFFFDYLRVTQDISIIKSGIEFYLVPSRAQPSVSLFSGQYRQEHQP
ncbi:RAQPRD family integrative conjugative element protein [Yersinia rochesterensis]|uniref:integrative conjugative element protein, RAQPRD family n=1 Tax=Yersinia TaxID=629 RepID=UPI00223EF8DB|nr:MULTISPECIES: RAQPRD family integrative conjugative element protein [Yersinia]MDA5543823.1 RAQPRD family integrative conjugative element protein [Yersinia rochesterensis]UZM74470.1 RAQPRD family integrative conjugative element protein [Yersinia sp. SCPM-O-B-9106 (C-191)]